MEVYSPLNPSLLFSVFKLSFSTSFLFLDHIKLLIRVYSWLYTQGLLLEGLRDLIGWQGSNLCYPAPDLLCDPSSLQYQLFSKVLNKVSFYSFQFNLLTRLAFSDRRL